MGCTTITVEGVDDPVAGDYGLNVCLLSNPSGCTEDEDCTVYIYELTAVEPYIVIYNTNDVDLDVYTYMNVMLPDGTTQKCEPSGDTTVPANSLITLLLDRVTVSDAGDYTIDYVDTPVWT